MKTSSFNLLAVSAAFFVMCASVMAAGPNGGVPSIIQTKCLKCHGGASVNGDLDFTQRLSLEQRLDAVAKAARGEMPKNGPKLTPSQFSQLKIELGINDAGASSASNDTPPVAPLTTSAAKARESALKAAASRAAAQNAAATAAATRAASQNAAATAAASQKAAAAAVANLKQAQARVSVVSSTSSGSSPSFSSADASSIPTARVRVVPAGSPSSKPVSAARVVVVTADDSSKTAVTPPKPVVKPQPVVTTTSGGSDNLKKDLDTLSSVKEDTSKIPEAIKGLVGDWMAVSRQGDGELSTVELQMDDHGWAKLTVPGADGKPSTTRHKVELKDNKLELTGQGGKVSLGKLVSADSRQMVLERETGLVTFVRP